MINNNDQIEVTKNKFEYLFNGSGSWNAVKKISENQLNVITLERGVGITSACGSGAGASAYASHKLKYCGNRVNVQMTGGNLNIEITKDDHIFWQFVGLVLLNLLAIRLKKIPDGIRPVSKYDF